VAQYFSLAHSAVVQAAVSEAVVVSAAAGAVLLAAAELAGVGEKIAACSFLCMPLFLLYNGYKRVVMRMHVTFYTKPNCGLCDEAKLMMQLVQEDFPFTWTEIDIQSDDEIHEKYMLMVPVIEKDGDVLLYGKIGFVDIVELF
jgi:glutaredoxin